MGVGRDQYGDLEDKPLTDEDEDDGDEDSLPGSEQRVSINGELQPNEKEKSNCLIRDNALCILTKTANPEVCHIVPLTVKDWIKSAIALNSFKVHLDLLLDDTVTNQVVNLLCGCGASDKPWNMLCLNDKLHVWRRQSRFRLKCLEIPAINAQESMIRIEFHWLPRNEIDPRKEMRLKSEEEHVNIAGTNRELTTGQIFEIGPMSHHYAQNMKAMLDLQWALRLLAALSGAAGRLDYLKEPDCEETNAMIWGWLQDTV
ncbi:hypothetical protein PT974_05439 [Cladobotryum mycophilum]|uniref:HNH nuclease domain-containing protein n=1 Tax=Cladobotryum mycophilum TaxID=491253 RepID=A0ABR0SIT6_9HYPO